MFRNRRIAAASSAAVTAAMLAALVLVLRSGFIPPEGAAWALKPSLVGPIVAQNGVALTEKTVRPALLIKPGQLPQGDSRRIAAEAGAAVSGTKPMLWMADNVELRRWLSSDVRGIQAVRVQVWKMRPGIAASLLGLARPGVVRMTRGPWSLKGGVYQLKLSARPVATTLNYALNVRMVGLARMGGAALVVNRDGGILAGFGSALRPEPLGMAALPPLLAEGLNNPKLSRALQQGALPLNQMAAIWGMSGLGRGLRALGFGQPSLASEGETPAIPASLSPAAFSQGVSLRVTPAELARSYLPFIDQGRVPRLAFAAAKSSGSASGAFREVLGQLPAVTANGVRFRVWRPVGNYAVVIAPSLNTVGVLEGAQVQNSMALLQDIADTIR